MAEYFDRSKPPLGIRPRWVVEEQRLTEIAEGALRYRMAGEIIPMEWLEEAVELTKYLQGRVK